MVRVKISGWQSSHKLLKPGTTKRRHKSQGAWVLGKYTTDRLNARIKTTYSPPIGPLKAPCHI